MARRNGVSFHSVTDSYTEPRLAIAAAVIMQTVQDVRGVKCSKVEQRDAQRFLYSEWFDTMCDGLGLDPFWIRRLAR